MIFQEKFWFISLFAFLFLLGCGKKQKEEAAEETTSTSEQTVAAIDPATAGNITGKIVFEGSAPKMVKIKMNADAVCAAAHATPQTSENVLVNSNGTLQNVFIYVKSGLENRKFNVPTEPVTLTQNGCMYTPHVFGIRAGQPIKIVNADPTMHNIHALPVKNEGFNMAQPSKGMESTKVFNQPEVMVKFKCDVHAWMHCYAGVLVHPFFAVTGTDGSFSLKTLPPGKYVIEAWHEDLGTQTQEVTIGEKETKEITFTFKPKQAS